MLEESCKITTFDKVWHDGIILSSKLMVLKVNYFRYSKILKIENKDPQRSVLVPLLFLIYINDIPDGINSLCKIFADDTSLFSKVYDIQKSARKLTDELEKISYSAYK